MRRTAPTRWRRSRAGCRATPPATPTWRGAASPTGARCWPSALDQAPYEPITSALVSGLKDEPSLDILAGWLASPDRRSGAARGRRVEGRAGPKQRDHHAEPAADWGDRDADPHQQARGADSVGAQGSQGMPGRGPAQAGRRRDLSRGARRASTRCSTYEHRSSRSTRTPTALVAAAGDRLVGAITDAIDERGRAQIVLTGGGTGIGLLKRVGEHGRHDRLVEGASVLGRRPLRPRRRRRAQREAGPRGAARPHRHPGRQRACRCRPATASSATTSTPRRWPTSRCWPPTPTTASPRRNSTCTCSAWAARATSTRCSRTRPRCARPTRLVVGVTDSPKPPPQRITLTLPAVQRSREVWLVVSGADKADAVAAAVGGAEPDDVPAAGAVGREATVWLLDEEAASKL